MTKLCWDLENVYLVTKSSLFEAANAAVLKSQVLSPCPLHPQEVLQSPRTLPWRMLQPGLHRHSSGELSGTLHIQLMVLCYSGIEEAASSSSSSFSSSDNHHKMFGASKESRVALPGSVSSLLLLLLMECHSISDLDSVHCTAKIALCCLEASFFPGANAPYCVGLAEAPVLCLSLARRRGSSHPLLLSSLSEAPLSHFLPWKPPRNAFDENKGIAKAMWLC